MIALTGRGLGIVGKEGAIANWGAHIQLYRPLISNILIETKDGVNRAVIADFGILDTANLVDRMSLKANGYFLRHFFGRGRR